MALGKKAAFCGYALIAAVLGGIGLGYLLASRIMPYHLMAMDSSWEELSGGMQNMSLNFMKSAGAGMLTTGIAMAFLLAKPFRNGEPWSRWALLTISLTEILIALYRSIDVSLNTPGQPYLAPLIVIGIISVASFFLSSGMSEESATRQERSPTGDS